MSVLVKVENNQWALAERMMQSHRKSRKSRKREKFPDNDDEVTNATRSFRVKEGLVQNIQMIVEKQCRRSRRSRSMKNTSCSLHDKWRMCSRIVMTSVCKSKWRLTVKEFHRDPEHRKERYCLLLRRPILMRLFRENVVEFPKVQKIPQAPNTLTVQKFSKVQHKREQYPIVLQQSRN